ncbi:hypothetical protein EC396_07645 [Lutibacter sp. HS1-25]|nr:hypothetical protein EC396_07645 [Lutibacter sp. HS1-25]
MSCSFLEDRTKQVQQVDTIVDFNSIDAFPLFPNCDEFPSREKQQNCFQIEMVQHIYASLKEYSLNATEVVNDTVFVKLIVDAQGKTSLSAIEISQKTKQLLPEFDSILKVSLQNLPKLQPAIKRNMPVATEFTLPIILIN